MAATFDQLVIISNDQGFRNRVYLALCTAAVAVTTESPSTTGHVARYAYAQRVLNTNSVPTGAILAVLSNSTISGEAVIPNGYVAGTTQTDFSIPDADIQFQINSIFSGLAGA